MKRVFYGLVCNTVVKISLSLGKILTQLALYCKCLVALELGIRNQKAFSVAAWQAATLKAF